MSWSSHAPVIITIASPTPFQKHWNWRLNESLIEDPLMQKEVKTHIDQFFQMNSTPDTAPDKIWEAHKCVILTRHGAKRKRQRTQETAELSRKVADLEKQHKSTLNDDTYSQLDAAKAELNSHLS
ncbi:Hypothetical predicted protein [Pelobates cultripes]|uniref:Uncharacterized protein n=1 Tax=Pelobates cultripes TaxID=61616 RepID=A0AAD1R024_PELCU|nr:Hypothetical predicted protein [Pelobates cultripes]